MASKKDSDNEENLQREEELSSLQNAFLTMALVPKEYSDLEELPMSPAVVTEGLSEPFVPLPRKKKPVEEPENETLERNVASQREVEFPSPKPKQQSELGASAFLLMGTVPKKDQEEKLPVQELSSKTEKEREPLEPKTEENPIPIPVEPETHNPPQSTVVSESESASTPAEPPKQEEPDESLTAKPAAPFLSHPQLKQNEAEEEEKGESEKGGMLSKARSLFSTITKKDKK